MEEYDEATLEDLADINDDDEEGRAPADEEEEDSAPTPPPDPRLAEMERIMDAVGWEDPSQVSHFVGSQMAQVREQQRQAEEAEHVARRQQYIDALGADTVADYERVAQHAQSSQNPLMTLVAYQRGREQQIRQELPQTIKEVVRQVLAEHKGFEQSVNQFADLVPDAADNPVAREMYSGLVAGGLTPDAAAELIRGVRGGASPGQRGATNLRAVPSARRMVESPGGAPTNTHDADHQAIVKALAGRFLKAMGD